MNDWIVIPKWHTFQHYGVHRRPPWIKNYTALLHKDEYLELPLSTRGLLHGIWLAYADTNGRLRVSDVPHYCRGRARDGHLKALSHAGLIDFRASKPLNLDLIEQDCVEPPLKPRTRPKPSPLPPEVEKRPLDKEEIERIKAWAASNGIR
jgi:hypothetical protein